MMNNEVYDQCYDKHILPLYKCTEYVDQDHDQENHLPHEYSIIDERVDMTHIECYSVDPPGCEDADDAFSV